MFRLLHLKLVLLLLISTNAFGQEKYWIDQDDISQNHSLIAELSPTYCSSWINACAFRLADPMVDFLKANGVKVTPVLDFKYCGNTTPTTSFALEQIEGDLFISEGLTGKGVKIGIIDGGFYKIMKDPSLKHLFEDSLVLGYTNYINYDRDLLAEKLSNDTHGTEVMQLVAGINPQKNVQFGLATQASFYLAKTDFDGYERMIEEDNLIKAMEWMGENGVQIINISLGYTNGFNDRDENHQPTDMDGKTTAVARAVEHASTQKGILVVVAAGNEDNNFRWKTLSSPGDAEHALTVGSTKIPVWDKTNFSSVGPDFTNFIKPDVAVFSGMGTSYSAPVITGLAACVKSYDQQLTNLEIIEIIQKSGHLYPFPNNHLGYGVPKCSNILAILKGNETKIHHPERLNAKGKQMKISLDYKENYLVVLHKNDRNIVLKRQVLRPGKRQIKVKRMKEATQSTLLFDQSAKEIFWQ